MYRWPQRIHRPIPDQDGYLSSARIILHCRNDLSIEGIFAGLQVLEIRRPGMKIALRGIVLKGEEIRENSTGL